MDQSNSNTQLKLNKIDLSKRSLVVIGAIFTMLSAGLTMSSFGVFFKPLSAQFGWTRAETALGVSVAFLVSGFLSMITGKLADSFGPRLIILISSGLGALACFLLSQMNNLWQYYLYTGVLLAFVIANVVPVSSMIARCYKRQRGLMTGITLGAGTLSTAIFAPATTSLIESFSWRVAYAAMGGAIVIFIIIAAIFLRDPSELQSTDSQGNDEIRPVPEKKKISFMRAVRSMPFWMLGAVLFCGGFAQQLVNIHLIPHITDMGISAIVAASVFSLTNMGVAAGNFSVSRLSGLISSRLTMAAGMAVTLISLFLFLFAGNVVVLYIFAILFGIGWGWTVTLRSVIIAELFGLHSHGVITGAIMFIFNLGGALGPPIAGYIFDVNGAYQMAFLMTFGIIILGLAAALWLKYRTKSLILD